MYAEGKGVVTRGRVVQGFLQVGDKVTVLPLGDAALISKVEHLQPPTVSSENATTNTQQDVGRLSVAVAGDTVEIVLANVDPMRVAVGNVVVDPTPHKYLPPIASTARAKILVMDNLTVPIIRGAQVVFHMHSLDVPASVTKLIALLNNTSSDTTANTNPILKERPRALTSGSSAIVELKLSDNTKIVMDRFQECRALGRFVLRRGGDTIAIGIIEEVLV
jgi:elongation factor 1 alpha-like protein